MAVNNKYITKSLYGGGSSSGTKKKSTVNTSYSDNLLGNGVSNPRVSLPKNLSYRDNLVNLQPVGGAGAGTGGVTSEGVVLGNPNVERMPQIKEKTDTSYSANLLNSAAQQPTAPITYGQQLAAAASPQQTPTESSPDTSGGTGATGSTGSTGGSTAGSGEVDTYEEFLLKQEGFYKEQLDKLNAQIEQNKQNALQQAESERERAVIDARSSYEQNKATYGANAEQLAAMGLSGSGYSDYLNQQAYATQRAETQNANAQAEATKLAAEQQANSDKLNAELSYAENMQGNAEKLAQYQQQKAEEAKAEEEQKKQYYAALLTSANTGEYTSEQIASLGAQYGLDEVQISQLQAAADKYKSDQQSLSYAEALQMISDYGADLDVSYLETLLNTGSISQEQYNQLMAHYSKELVESGDVATEDTDKIDDLHQSGQISEEDYNKQKEQWNSQIDTSDAFFNSGSMSATEAKKQLDEILNSEWTSEKNKKALQKTYDSLYKIVQNDVKFNNDGGWWIFGSTDMGDVGNNFSLIDDSGFKYRIESGGEVTDAAIKSLASSVSNGSVFGARGQIYYKKDGKVYLIQKRESSYGDHYTKLYNKFFG
jgi:hypothetical protein